MGRFQTHVALWGFRNVSLLRLQTQLPGLDLEWQPVSWKAPSSCPRAWEDPKTPFSTTVNSAALLGKHREGKSDHLMQPTMPAPALEVCATDAMDGEDSHVP
jgi:hypothetical protein